MKEKVLLSGGHGFIGSSLVKRFEAEGKEIAYIDRDGTWPGGYYDYVYYLASYGNYHDQKDRNLIYEVNADRVKKLLNIFRSTPPKLFTYFSSSSVYGSHPYRMNEETTLDGQTDYARAKILGEYICAEYTPYMPILIVRPFSVIGEEEQSRHFVPTAIKAALTNTVLNLDPTPTHDFIDVFDVVNAVELLTNIKKQIKHLDNIFNICSGKQYSNLEIVKMIEKISGKKIKLKLVDNLREYDTTHWLGDPSLLEWLGWRRKYTLEDSLRDMINYYHKHGNKE